jgi:hypothetical protein
VTHLSSIFDGLDGREIDYVKARVNEPSDRKALQVANLSYGWLRSRNVEDLNRRAMAFKADVTYRAQEILESAVEEAARVKANGLKSRDERVKQLVATELLDRAFGKPTQRTELTGADGGAIEVNDARENIQRKLAGISNANGAG